MSFPVPAGNGTTYRTGFTGKFCAWQTAEHVHTTAANEYSSPRLAITARITHLLLEKGTYDAGIAVDAPAKRVLAGGEIACQSFRKIMAPRVPRVDDCGGFYGSR